MPPVLVIASIINIFYNCPLYSFVQVGMSIKMSCSLEFFARFFLQWLCWILIVFLVGSIYVVGADTRKYSIWIWCSSSPFIVISKKQVYSKAALYYSSILYVFIIGFWTSIKNETSLVFFVNSRNRITLYANSIRAHLSVEKRCVFKSFSWLAIRKKGCLLKAFHSLKAYDFFSEIESQIMHKPSAEQ